MPTHYQHVPWQRNIRKLPSHVTDWLITNPGTPIIVGCVKTIPTTELANYEHLRIGLAGGAIVYPEARVPVAEMGPYSTKNRDGWEVKRVDLPMITRTFSFDVPNWGDAAYGYHTVDQKREVYQRDYNEAPNIAIRLECLKEAPGVSIFKIFVDWPMNRDCEDFERDLLFALNLLQENVGTCGVMPADANANELLSSLDMSWEFFPPGTAAEVERFFSGSLKQITPELQVVIRERAQIFWNLEPVQYLRGTGGMSRYVGAQFAEDLVVFENVKYGNAIWVLFENWSEASKRSRINLLRLRDVRYERIIHNPGWQDRLIGLVRNEKKKRGIKIIRGSGSGRAA